MIIADDPTISRAHAEISVGGDGVARVRDLSKFGTKIDARARGPVPPGGRSPPGRGSRRRSRPRPPHLRREDPRRHRRGAGSRRRRRRVARDARGLGRDDRGGGGGRRRRRRARRPGSPGDEDASSLSRRNAARVQPEPRRGGALPSAVSAASVALARAAADRRRAARDSADRAEAADGEAPAEAPALHAEAPALNAEASPRRERDAAYAAREGKSTVVFESIKASRSRKTAEPAGRRADPRNFKKFRKASSLARRRLRRRRVDAHGSAAPRGSLRGRGVRRAAPVGGRGRRGSTRGGAAGRREPRTRCSKPGTRGRGKGAAPPGKRKAAAAPRKPRGRRREGAVTTRERARDGPWVAANDPWGIRGGVMHRVRDASSGSDGTFARQKYVYGVENAETSRSLDVPPLLSFPPLLSSREIHGRARRFWLLSREPPSDLERL